MEETWAKGSADGRRADVSGVDLHLDLSGTRVRAGLEGALRDAIRAGRLRPGTRLPSSRALATDLGVAGSVTFTGSGHYTLVLKDTTQGWSHTVHKTLNGGANSSAEVIAEAPSSNSGILPLTNFGTAHFSNAAVNGAAMGNANPTKITMVNGSGRAKDSVSALAGGTAFSVKWLHSTR